MPLAFDPSGQERDKGFSGIGGEETLYVEEVYHKAFVDVNEEGTEAAAATGVVMYATSAPTDPLIFKADHPFIFLIQERTTGYILFMGKVANPAK